MTEKKLFTLYVNRQDGNPERPIKIPEVLRGRPFVLAVSPAYFIDGELAKSPKGIGQIQEALSQGAILGQRGGLTDKCKYERFHRLTHTDPWHTNFCPYNPFGYSEEEQGKGILEGREILANRLGHIPQVYCPVNHLFTERTLDALFGTGFRFIIDRNIIGFLPYVRHGIVVIPEVNLPRKESSRESAAMYCALSDFRGENVGKIIKILEDAELVTPDELAIHHCSPFDIALNQFLKFGWKLARDARNILVRKK